MIRVLLTLGFIASSTMALPAVLPIRLDYSILPHSDIWINRIRNDGWSAACYYTFCECGVFYSTKPEAIQKTCPLRLTAQARKTVASCNSDVKICKPALDHLQDGAFVGLFTTIMTESLDEKSCNLYLPQCYNIILRDEIKLMEESVLLENSKRQVVRNKH